MAAQEEVLEGLLKKGQATAFGRAHGLRSGMSIQAFQEAVPVRPESMVATDALPKDGADTKEGDPRSCGPSRL